MKGIDRSRRIEIKFVISAGKNGTLMIAIKCRIKKKLAAANWNRKQPKN